jgi:hypothetical protein
MVAEPAQAVALARKVRGEVEPGTRVAIARPVARAPVIRIGAG